MTAAKIPSPLSMPESVAILDKDKVFLSIVEKFFLTQGIPVVETFKNSTDGWHDISKQEDPYQFLVMDWELDDLSGVKLFNRIRQHSLYRDTPILVFSSKLEKEDFQLLSEFPLSHFLAKPFREEKLQGKLEEMMTEKKWQIQNWTGLEKLLVELNKSNTRENIDRVKTQIGSSPNPVPLALMACRILSEKEFYVEAEEIAREVIFADPKSILAKNELAKSLILQGKHKAAGDILTEADQMSPKNIERLCLLGEVGLNLSNPIAAREIYKRALDIDEDSKRAQAGLHMVNVVEKNISAFHSAGDNIAKNFASVLNTVAITNIHKSKFKEGIEQYRSALTFLNTRITMSKLTFNLGLAYLKEGSYKEAYPWFLKSIELNKDMDKAKKYVARLRKMFESKDPNKPRSSEEFVDKNIDVEWE